MSTWEALILGIVQGLTEFLPVSSSGHLVVFQKIFDIKQHDITFDVIAHFGTLIAVIIVYKDSLREIARALLQKRFQSNEVKIANYVVIASIPTVIIGLTLRGYFEQMFQSLFIVGVFFILTGFILYATKRFNDKSEMMNMAQGIEGAKTLNHRKAFLIGLAQSFAISPGISRSGSTIATAILLGVRRDTAAMFSFLLAIPAISGAMLLELNDLEVSQIFQLNYMIGFLAALISGYIGLKSLLRVIRNGNLSFFSVYLWLLGIGCLIYTSL